MNPIASVKKIAARDLSLLKTLLDTYNTITQGSLSFSTDIVSGVAQQVLNSNEIKNAMSYAKIGPDEMLNRTIENTEELLELRDSPLTGLTAYQSNNNSSFVEDMTRFGQNLVRTLKENAAPDTDGTHEGSASSQRRSRPFAVKSAVASLVSFFDEKLGVTFDGLSSQMANAIVRLIASIACVYIALDVTLGIFQGIFFVIFINFLLIFTVLLVVRLDARGRNYHWVLSEEDFGSMARTVIAPFIREQINEEVRKAQLEDAFNVTTAPGLNELSDREQIIDTATMHRVRTLLNTMTYGSIGISGARGTGKSVLLKAFCDERLRQHDFREFGILVSAPVDYDGRDFILHLFSTLCARVIDFADTSNRTSTLRRIAVKLYQLGVIVGGCLIAAEAGVKLSRSQVGFAERFGLAMIIITIILAPLTRVAGISFAIKIRHAATAASNLKPTLRPTKARWFAIPITAAIVIAMVAAAIFIDFSKMYVSPQSFITHIVREKRFWPGAAVLIFALAIGIVNSFISSQRKERRTNIAERAREHLRRIESIRTVTSGQSANVGFGSKFQLNHSRSSQLTERDLSLPAIVDLYRDFTTDVVAWWRNRHSSQDRLVIGIDELDKIINTESAERFLNEIKAVFGIPGCLYLVSTSQDALLQFEGKSLGFRSAFDSAFDDIIRVDTLSLIDTHQLLLKRLAGISYPFIVLCHIFSSGLCRDVLRSARSMVEARCNGSISLTEICSFLITQEIDNLKMALLTAYGIQGSSEHGRIVEGALVGTLLDSQWPGTDSHELLSAATSGLRDAFPEMHAALCFLATVYDLVVNGNRKSWTDCFISGVIQDGIEDLSEARRWLSTDPRTALELVREARSKLDMGPLVCDDVVGLSCGSQRPAGRSGPGILTLCIHGS